MIGTCGYTEALSYLFCQLYAVYRCHVPIDNDYVGNFLLKCFKAFFGTCGSGDVFHAKYLKNSFYKLHRGHIVVNNEYTHSFEV